MATMGVATLEPPACPHFAQTAYGAVYEFPHPPPPMGPRRRRRP